MDFKRECYYGDGKRIKNFEKIFDMKKIIIKNNSNEITADVFCFLDYKNIEYKNKENFVDQLIENFPEISKIGYAGFKDAENLKEYLVKVVFDSGKFEKNSKVSFDEKKIQKIVSDYILKCKEKLNSDRTYIFIFPNFSQFKKEKMNGVGGLCCWKNTILVDINPVKGWQSQLAQTLCHEFHHSIIAKKRNPQTWTLLEGLVYEGMADNFAKSITGRASLWTRAISPKESRVIFEKIKNRLNKNDANIYQQVFFGKNGKYPFWVGYAIGYQMVRSYLEKNSDLNWNEISKRSVLEILKNYF